MQRRGRTLVGRLVGGGAMACGLLLGAGPIAAQTPTPLAPRGVPEGRSAAPGQDETAPRLFAAPDGDLYRLWQREGDPRAGGGSVLVAQARPQDAWRMILEIAPAEAGVTARDPDLAFGPSSDDLALVYRWWRHEPRSKQIRLVLSKDGGKTWTQSNTQVDGSGKAFDPKVVWSAGRGLVVVWSDERRSNRLFDVYARYSPDGGTTWEPEQLLSRFAKSIPSDLYNQARVVSDGKGRVWVVWIGVRGTKSSLFMNRSVDGGRTWTEPVLLSGESQSVFGQSLVRAGDRMLLVWQDNLGGPDRIYATSSSDAGATWTAPVRVDHLPAGAPAASSASVLLGDGGEALVAWQDARNGRDDIFLGRSQDGGRTWSTADQRIDLDDPGTGISRLPKLSRARDGRVAIAWEDDRAGYESVFLRIRSAGATPEWGPEIIVAPSAGKLAARVPEVAWARDGVHVTWQVWDNTLAPGRIDKSVASRTVPVDRR